MASLGIVLFAAVTVLVAGSIIVVPWLIAEWWQNRRRP
jgi:hypothetical protein